MESKDKLTEKDKSDLEELIQNTAPSARIEWTSAPVIRCRDGKDEMEAVLSYSR